MIVTAVDNDRPAGSPRAVITLPENGEVVSGSQAEFFGDGTDNGTLVKAEFFVDGIKKSTDVNSEGHYHIGGAHNLWNTKQLGNGTHTLMMKVFDNQGLTASHVIKVTVSN